MIQYDRICDYPPSLAIIKIQKSAITANNTEMNQHEPLPADQSPTRRSAESGEQTVLPSETSSHHNHHEHYDNHQHPGQDGAQDRGQISDRQSSQNIDMDVDTDTFDDDYIRSGTHNADVKSESNHNNILRVVFVTILVIVFGIGFGAQRMFGSYNVQAASNSVTAIFVAVSQNQTNILRSLGQFIQNTQQQPTTTAEGDGDGQNKNNLQNPQNPQQPNILDITQIILIYNFTLSSQTLDYLAQNNITLLATNRKMTMQLMDTVLSNIRTSYYYLSTTDWLVQEPRYLQYSINILENNQKIVQIVADQTAQQPSPKTEKAQFGYSFSPSLHRMADYQLLEKDGELGLAAVAGDECEVGARKCEQLLSKFYLQAGREVYVNKMFGLVWIGARVATQGSINTLKNKDFNQQITTTTNTNTHTNTNTNNPSSDTKISASKLEAIYTMIKNSEQSRLQKQKQKQLYHITQNNPNINTNTNKNTDPSSTPTPPTPTPPTSNNNNAVTDGQTIQAQNVYIKDLTTNIRQPPQVTTLNLNSNTQSYQQMPFCIILMPDTNNVISEQITTSAKQQKYTNYSVINLPKQSSPEYSYTDVHKYIRRDCKKNSVLLFVNHTLSADALEYFNGHHQKYRTYLTYAKDKDGNVEVYSVLWRVFQLLWLNDFQGVNRKYMESWDSGAMAVGLVELAQNYGKIVQKNRIVDGSSNPRAYFSIYLTDQHFASFPQNKPYQKLIKLSQDYLFLPETLEKSNKFAQKSPYQHSQINKTHMLYAIQRQQIPYLPQNHLISQTQYQYYNLKYNISQYSTAEQQQRLCITVISHNNIQNNRYKKLVQSIHQQVYTNYHVVFVDDFSSDGNLESTYRQFVSVGFDMSRIVFVRNKMRNYATYNIINAAYSYCGEDQIQMMIDGDDELIGRYALQVINSAYRSKKDTWIVYSNYKTSQFTYGLSRRFYSDEEHVFNNKRKPISFIGPIRTWKVKLICHIPMLYHKMKDGNWLNTVSDDAIQHPLLELATIKRVTYIPEIMYEYNIKYGDNDDSSPQKVKYRKKVYWELIKLKPLDPLDSLDQAVKKAQIQSALRMDKGVKYETYQV